MSSEEDTKKKNEVPAAAAVVADDFEETIRDPPAETSDLPLPNKGPSAAQIADAYSFMPKDARILCLTGTGTRPKLLLRMMENVPKEDFTYDLGENTGGKAAVYIMLESETGAYSIKAPMSILKYKRPALPEDFYNPKACHEVDMANESITQHNRVIVDILSDFIRKSGCGTSAGYVTLPPPPDGFEANRVKRANELFADKYSTTILAIRYLHTECHKVCEVDYTADAAVETANNEAVTKDAQRQIDKGRLRWKHFASEKAKKASSTVEDLFANVPDEERCIIKFRITGSPPATWCGLKNKPDSLGRLVQWIAGPAHSFVHPEAVVELQQKLDLIPM